MTSALAPGYVALTATVGGAMSGYIDTGNERNAASPAITMNADTTIANNGRSMKKFESMARGYECLRECLRRRLGVVRGRLPFRGLRRPAFTRGRLHFHCGARMHFENAIRDDA